MSTTTANRPVAPLPAADPLPALPPREEQFPESAELGAQLLNLTNAQVEIDRQKAGELARLRELQDRD